MTDAEEEAGRQSAAVISHAADRSAGDLCEGTLVSADRVEEAKRPPALIIVVDVVAPRRQLHFWKIAAVGKHYLVKNWRNLRSGRQTVSK